MGKPIPVDMIFRLNVGESQTKEILGLMDDYGIEYRDSYRGALIERLADNSNRLTIDMLDEVILTMIDGQVGKIIVDHINDGIYNIHSFNNIEWHEVDE